MGLDPIETARCAYLGFLFRCYSHPDGYIPKAVLCRYVDRRRNFCKVKKTLYTNRKNGQLVPMGGLISRAHCRHLTH